MNSDAGQEPRREIILVEDCPDDAELLIKLIHKEANGIEVRHFADGETALEFLHQVATEHEPHVRLVILDLNLPKLDGRDILLKAGPAISSGRVRVVVFSGSESPEDKRKCLASGAAAFYSKPWSLAAYKDFVHGLLASEMQAAVASSQATSL